MSTNNILIKLFVYFLEYVERVVFFEAAWAVNENGSSLNSNHQNPV